MKGMAAQVQQLQEEMAGMKSIMKAMNTPLWWGRKPEEVLATLETEKVGAEEHDDVAAAAAAGIILEKKERTDEERKMVSFHIAAQMYQDRQAALKRGPVVKNCKSCGRTGHCRKSHNACPRNPRRIARKLAQQRYCIARQAAWTIQAWWRRRRARARHAQAQVQKVQAQTVAAEKIQACWRRRHAWAQTQKAQAPRRFTGCHYNRTLLAKRCKEKEARNKAQAVAIEKIQAWWRGRQARELLRTGWMCEWRRRQDKERIWMERYGWRELEGWPKSHEEQIRKILHWHRLNDGPLAKFSHWGYMKREEERAKNKNGSKHKEGGVSGSPDVGKKGQ